MADKILSTVLFPGDIVFPNSPSNGGYSGSSGGRGDSTRTELKEVISGDDKANIFDSTSTASIWWWCIVYNNLTHVNLDLVYSTEDVMFDWEHFKVQMKDFVTTYINGSKLSLQFLNQDYTSSLYNLLDDLAFDRITQQEFDEKSATLLEANPYINVDLMSGLTADQVYKLVSFRRILNPALEYLPYKKQIDELHKQQLNFDLIASDRATRADSSVKVNLQAAKDVLRRQVDTLTIYKTSVKDAATLGVLEQMITNLLHQINKSDETLEKINNGRF